MRRSIATLAAVAAITTSARADAPSGMYVDQLDGTIPVVLDTRTGLTWMRDASPSIAFATAESWCAAKGPGWSVPTYVELVSIVDDTRAIGVEPMIDPVHFPKTPLSSFWCTARTRPAGFPLTVGFDGPGAGLNDRDSALPVRCVKRKSPT